MQVACPHCNQALEVPDHLAGQVARCGVCGTLFTVPGGVDGPPPPGPMPPSTLSQWQTPAGTGGVGDEAPLAGSDFTRAGGGTYGDVPGAATYPPLQYRPMTYPAGPTADQVRARVGVVGGLVLGLGIFGILLAGVLLLAYYAVLYGDPSGLEGPAAEMDPMVFAISGVGSLAAGLFHLMAGVQLLRRRLRARAGDRRRHYRVLQPLELLRLGRRHPHRHLCPGGPRPQQAHIAAR